MKGFSEGSADLPVDVPIEPLRRLARGLLYDRQRAEDVVQEAWLAALRRRDEVQSLGEWLAGAVRRLAGNANREQLRRTRRERRAARPEATPGTAEVSARIEILRRLLDAVDRLDEPYRAAIALRFFDELPPREMARRLGVPVNTARSRVRRGLEHLRAELDGEGGRNREAFLGALVPFAGSPGGFLGWSGVFAMQQKIVWAAVLAALLGVAWVLRAGLREERSRGALVEGATPLAVPSDPGGVALASTQDPSKAEQRVPLEHAAPVTGDWILRGNATRGKGEPDAGLRLFGRVHDGPRATGEVLVKAYLQADDAGAFAWALPAPERVVTISIEPLASGHRHRAEGTCIPGDPAPEDWSVRTCAVDASLAGVVRDAEQEPIAGARVATLEDETTTDAEGRYRLPASSFHGEAWIRAVAAGFAEANRKESAEPGENEVEALVLVRERRVSGRVLDAVGEPLEGVRLRRDDRDPLEVRSDAEGRFTLGGFDPRAEYVRVQARLEGYADGSAAGKADEPLEIRLLRGVPVAGRVLAPDRTPLAFVRVAIGATPYDGLEAWSDLGGAFVVANVPSGKNKIWGLRRGFAEASQEIEVSSAGGLPLELVLESEHVLGGIVLDAEGEPCPGAGIFAEDGRYQGRMFVRTALTGPDGRFRLERLPAIEVRLGVDAPGHARLTETVGELDRADLVLRLAPLAGFAGRVVEAGSGVPVSIFTVHVRFPDFGEREGAVDSLPPEWVDGVSFEDAAGRWSLIDDHAPGALAALEIEAPGFAPALLESVPARAPAVPDELVIALVRGTLVRGHVVERESGRPIAGARVLRFTGRVPPESLEDGQETLFEARTDVRGAFELRDVPTGPMSLAIRHPDWPALDDGPFVVEGARPVERWVELAQGGILWGHLLDVAGRPLASETVALEGLEVPGGEHAWRVVTTADGSYSFSGLPAGTFQLSWLRRLGEAQARDLSRHLELAEGETRAVELRPRGGATLRGELGCVEPLPATVLVRILPLTGDSGRGSREGGPSVPAERAILAEGGAFVLEGLEPGRHRVDASFRNPRGVLFSGDSGAFEVPAAGEVRVALELRAR